MDSGLKNCIRERRKSRKAKRGQLDVWDKGWSCSHRAARAHSLQAALPKAS